MSSVQKQPLDILIHNDKTWNLIEEYITNLSKTKDIHNFIKIYHQYTPKFRYSNKQIPKNYKLPDCQALSKVFTCRPEINYDFFSSILPYICRLVSQSRDVLPVGKLYLLDSFSNPIVKLNQLQCLTLLAMMFVGLFPENYFANGKRGHSEGLTNFHCDDMFSGSRAQCSEKIKCLLAYFKIFLNGRSPEESDNDLYEEITWKHYRISKNWCNDSWRSVHFDSPDWKNSSKTVNLKHLLTFAEPKQSIDEFQKQGICADFASSSGQGGGVVRSGCAQEEIKFLTHCELICSLLFCRSLGDDDVIFVEGFSKYIEHTGYSSSFKFKYSKYDSGIQTKDQLVMLNAKNVNKDRKVQYFEHNIMRDLNKIYLTGVVAKNEKKPVITGNWGCGAYGNDVYLKYLIQVLGFCQAECEFVYCAYDNLNALEDFKKLVDVLEGQSVSSVLKTVLGYSKLKGKAKIPFKDYILEDVL